MKCAICGRGIDEGVSLYRMNATGQPGLWSCNEHKDHFDGRIPESVKMIVETIERKGPKR